MLTQELVHSMFDYKDGELFRKTAPRGFKIGQKAGTVTGGGYVSIRINGKKYMAHRIVYLMQHGYMPEFIDHINNDRADNRIENLRPITKQQNAQNAKLRQNSSSGYKNVRWHKTWNSWQVAMRIDGKETNFGYYKDIELADLVATEARDKHYGKYANHGVQL